VRAVEKSFAKKVLTWKLMFVMTGAEGGQLAGQPVGLSWSLDGWQSVLTNLTVLTTAMSRPGLNHSFKLKSHDLIIVWLQSYTKCHLILS